MLNRLFGVLGWLGSILVFTAVAVWFVRPDLDQLRRVLASTHGNKTEAASLLRISRSRLTRYVERFGL